MNNATIDRKTAEAARRIALVNERLLDGADPQQPGYAELDSERRESVAVWNAFCAEETRRLAAKPITYARILPGVYVPSR